MVATEYHADSTVRAVLRYLVGVFGIHVWLEVQFVKTHLNTHVQWNGTGTKRDDLATLDNLEVVLLARVVVMVVLLLVGILQPIDILVPASALCFVSDLGGE